MNVKNISKEKAMRCLTPDILKKIYYSIKKAIERYFEKHQQENIVYTSRTKANIISDYIVDYVKEEFTNDPRISMSYIRQSFRLSVNNGEVIIRFKKMNRRARTGNVPTQQALNFEEQLTLFEDSININAGYIKEDLDYRIMLACPNGKENAWIFELEEDGEMISPIVPMLIPLPTSPQHNKRKVLPIRRNKNGKAKEE